MQVIYASAWMENNTEHSNCVHFDFVELFSDLIRTRGNEYKLAQHHCHYDLKKYFTNRVIPVG